MHVNWVVVGIMVALAAIRGWVNAGRSQKASRTAFQSKVDKRLLIDDLRAAHPIHVVSVQTIKD